jgi:hypothetical protein
MGRLRRRDPLRGRPPLPRRDPSRETVPPPVSGPRRGSFGRRSRRPIRRARGRRPRTRVWRRGWTSIGIWPAGGPRPPRRTGRLCVIRSKAWRASSPHAARPRHYRRGPPPALPRPPGPAWPPCSTPARGPSRTPPGPPPPPPGPPVPCPAPPVPDRPARPDPPDRLDPPARLDPPNPPGRPGRPGRPKQTPSPLPGPPDRPARLRRVEVPVRVVRVGGGHGPSVGGLGSPGTSSGRACARWRTPPAGSRRTRRSASARRTGRAGADGGWFRRGAGPVRGKGCDGASGGTDQG